MKKLSLLALLAGAGLSTFGQTANPLTSDVKFVYTNAKNNILKSAEKMPEEDYTFKPTPDVRSFAGLLGHIADAQYSFCGAVKGESKRVGVEKSKTSKADLTAALKEAFAYCDAAYDSMTDASGVGMVKLFGTERTKLGVLAFNNAHTYEHYGNLVTYMRMKNLVPPSSERR
ncbi:MAG TPA: DinB family protein [Bryobacteraceae bacterium]|jgi:uncharacterized damage-inducible protein DinB|nr:DinB family protein [Bryobacteraceae bacterium]